MNAALKGGQALTNQLNGFGSSSKNAGKSSSTTSKSVADLSSAFDTLTKAMKEYNQYGYISADTMKSLIGVDDKFTACLTEQNGNLSLTPQNSALLSERSLRKRMQLMMVASLLAR